MNDIPEDMQKLISSMRRGSEALGHAFLDYPTGDIEELLVTAADALSAALVREQTAKAELIEIVTRIDEARSANEDVLDATGHWHNNEVLRLLEHLREPFETETPAEPDEESQ